MMSPGSYAYSPPASQYPVAPLLASSQFDRFGPDEATPFAGSRYAEPYAVPPFAATRYDWDRMDEEANAPEGGNGGNGAIRGAIVDALASALRNVTKDTLQKEEVTTTTTAPSPFAAVGSRLPVKPTFIPDLSDLIAFMWFLMLIGVLTPSIIGSFFDFVDPLAWLTTGLPHIFGRAAPGGYDVIHHVMDYFWPTNRTQV